MKRVPVEVELIDNVDILNGFFNMVNTEFFSATDVPKNEKLVDGWINNRMVGGYYRDDEFVTDNEFLNY